MAKEIRILTASIIMLMISSLQSCNIMKPALEVLSGNLSYGRGQYQKAILHYLSAEKQTDISKDVVQYNLGNVFYTLGEGDEALEVWSMAEESTEDVNILFRIAFNRGIVYMNKGSYEEAYQSFRQALILQPSDIDSKINIEDALSRIRSEVSQSPSAEDIPRSGDEAENNLLLDYIRRKEAEGWSSQKTGESNEQDW